MVEKKENNYKYHRIFFLTNKIESLIKENNITKDRKKILFHMKLAIKFD